MGVDKAKKKVIDGLLVEYFVLIPQEIKKVDDEEKMIRLSGVKAVTYTAMPHSHSNEDKIMNTISKLENCNSKRNVLYDRMKAIEKRLDIKRYPGKYLELMEKVFTTDSYTKAGKQLGYSKNQVFRSMSKIYERMQRNI